MFAGANLTANLRDFFTRGKLGGKGKRQEEQDLGGFVAGGPGEVHRHNCWVCGGAGGDMACISSSRSCCVETVNFPPLHVSFVHHTAQHSTAKHQLQD